MWSMLRIRASSTCLQQLPSPLGPRDLLVVNDAATLTLSLPYPPWASAGVACGGVGRRPGRVFFAGAELLQSLHGAGHPRASAVTVW